MEGTRLEELSNEQREKRLERLLAESQDLLTLNCRYGLRLLDNARAFAESAVEYARQNGSDQWKFAILHLATALELLLKAKLALKHQKYLVAGAGQITDQQFDEGDFRSVDVEECIKRLKRHCNFEMPAHQRRVITTLRNLRNRFTHYAELSRDTGPLKAATAAGLNLFIDLNNSEFSEIDSYGAKPIQKLIETLTEYDDFVKERLSSLAGRLRSAPRPLTYTADECSVCLQDAAIIDNDDLRCLFCGTTTSISEFAKRHSDDRSAELCPVCGREAVSIYRLKESDPTHECFCCGYLCGPEPRLVDWRNGFAEMPRCHQDRSCWPSLKK